MPHALKTRKYLLQDYCIVRYYCPPGKLQDVLTGPDDLHGRTVQVRCALSTAQLSRLTRRDLKSLAAAAGMELHSEDAVLHSISRLLNSSSSASLIEPDLTLD
eukprot:COSAG03_NODE_18323_length_357_cov_1.193798_1_plen_102_part_10